ncbi:uncharacterized protein LOC21390657 [Morus notabilis]|uniref:uncharacterized protein LOC21390657 n=1 Tax=Morus notabilis TaxID=981085 RepID=UPI000CED0101|nr:uncharacterized protein LOC21390657 [Morus notabilis]
MKPHQPKLKTQLFSCGFFRHCTQTVLSPTTPHQQQPESSSSSSSSSASQSFTQWRFPLPNSLIHLTTPISQSEPVFQPDPLPPTNNVGANLQELFHAAELQLSSGSDSDRVTALQLLERSLVPDPPVEPECPPGLMRGVVDNLRSKPGAKPASKILLALCLAEGNRRVAVEAGAVAAVVEVMGRASAREKEYAISVLAVIYGGASATEADGGEEVVTAPPEEVARAVALALQGECSARGRRKGVQLLKTLQDSGQSQTTVV